jgi:NAD(P)-dependent dehydrogenase (short-subunit alcohol dehydrogenase family)
MSLEGQVAIVTGGASGIGRALAGELAQRGCEVVLADRQAELAHEAARDIEGRGGRATAAELDVRDLAAWKRVVDETLDRSKRIDFLFNNAGIAIGAEVREYEPKDFDDVFDVNLRGVAYGVLAVYPTMIAQGSGHIVNTASVAGLVAAGGAVSYSAAKHGVVALSKSLRIEAAEHGVKVSALCPGAIRTPILSGGVFGGIKLAGGTPQAVLRQWERVRPMDPAKFARRAIDRVLADDAVIVIPRWWKALWYLERISPSLALRVGATTFRRIRDEIRKDGASDPAHAGPQPALSATRNGTSNGTNGFHPAAE